MILKALLMMFALLILSGCSSKEVEYKYIDVPFEVKVPVKCKVPETHCDFNRTTDTEVIDSLLECVVSLKKNSEVCK